MVEPLELINAYTNADEIKDNLLLAGFNYSESQTATEAIRLERAQYVVDVAASTLVNHLTVLNKRRIDLSDELLDVETEIEQIKSVLHQPSKSDRMEKLMGLHGTQLSYAATKEFVASQGPITMNLKVPDHEFFGSGQPIPTLFGWVRTEHPQLEQAFGKKIARSIVSSASLFDYLLKEIAADEKSEITGSFELNLSSESPTLTINDPETLFMYLHGQKNRFGDKSLISIFCIAEYQSSLRS